MKTTMVLFAAAIAVAIAAAGCGGASCKSRCEKKNMCPGATATDCETVCMESDMVTMATGCGSQSDAVSSCFDGLSMEQFCSNSSCSSEVAAYGACVGAYCLAHTTDPACM